MPRSRLFIDDTMEEEAPGGRGEGRTTARPRIGAGQEELDFSDLGAQRARREGEERARRRTEQHREAADWFRASVEESGVKQAALAADMMIGEGALCDMKRGERPIPGRCFLAFLKSEDAARGFFGWGHRRVWPAVATMPTVNLETVGRALVRLVARLGLYPLLRSHLAAECQAPAEAIDLAMRPVVDGAPVVRVAVGAAL